MLFESRQKTDLLFGSMKFRRSFGFFGAGFWQGEVDFAPVGKRVKIYVPAGRNGVSEKQRDFYRQLEQHYADIIVGTLEILHETFHNYMWGYFSEYTREENLGNCELDSIYISDLKEAKAEWSLSFMHMPHQQTYSVYFEDWKPIYGLLDD